MEHLTFDNLSQLEKGHNASSGGIVIGNRVPKDYFSCKGTGESDIAIHAGSYHLALKDAGIERANIMTYSSILPAIANEIERPKEYTHGAVMETIMAVANGHKDEEISAGIIYGWLYNRKTNEKFGGLVCEHNGQYQEKEIENLLYASLNELYINGFEEEYTLGEKKIITNSLIPSKKYGTVLVGLCFTSYYYPVMNDTMNHFS